MKKTQFGATILEGSDIADLPLVSRNAQILEDEILKDRSKLESLEESIKDVPQVFHDVEPFEVKEEMNPGDFSTGVTLCNQRVTDFPSIGKAGVSITFSGSNNNYAQIFITKDGDIWSRRSNSFAFWAGEWYNSKKNIDELSKELDTVKQSGVKSNKRLSDKLNSLEIPASDKDSISTNIGKLEGIPNHRKLTKTITTQGGKHIITPGYYEGGEVKAQFTNLTPGNIRTGVNIGGVVGNYYGSPSGETIYKTKQVKEDHDSRIDSMTLDVPNLDKAKVITVHMQADNLEYDTLRSSSRITTGTYIRESTYKFNMFNFNESSSVNESSSRRRLGLDWRDVALSDSDISNGLFTVHLKRGGENIAGQSDDYITIKYRIWYDN